MYCVFIFIQLKIKIFPYDFYFDPGLHRRVLISNCLRISKFLLLIYNLIPLWSENILWFQTFKIYWDLFYGLEDGLSYRIFLTNWPFCQYEVFFLSLSIVLVLSLFCLILTTISTLFWLLFAWHLFPSQSTVCLL